MGDIAPRIFAGHSMLCPYERHTISGTERFCSAGVPAGGFEFANAA